VESTRGWVAWVGRVISVLAALAFIASAALKFKGGPEIAQGFSHLGLPESMRMSLGILEMSVAAVYLVPPLAVLGAILLTGYVGGTIITHWRIGEPVFVQIILGILVWLGLYLREPRLKALIPIRKRPSA
jgi:hypothetical protein